MTSLYERLGGADAIDAAVEEFYRRMLADDHVNRFFDGIDMTKQAAKQKAFITMATGGPDNYTGLDMARGHAHLLAMGMDDTHVDTVIKHLDGTLADFGIADDDRETVRNKLEGLRDAVMGRIPGA
jgi:hemoglobin